VGPPEPVGDGEPELLGVPVGVGEPVGDDEPVGDELVLGVLDALGDVDAEGLGHGPDCERSWLSPDMLRPPPTLGDGDDPTAGVPVGVGLGTGGISVLGELELGCGLSLGHPVEDALAGTVSRNCPGLSGVGDGPRLLLLLPAVACPSLLACPSLPAVVPRLDPGLLSDCGVTVSRSRGIVSVTATTISRAAAAASAGASHPRAEWAFLRARRKARARCPLRSDCPLAITTSSLAVTRTAVMSCRGSQVTYARTQATAGEWWAVRSRIFSRPSPAGTTTFATALSARRTSSPYLPSGSVIFCPAP
jgi:hypothetical protein